MVRELTSLRGKEVVTLLQGINHISELLDFYAANLLQLLDVSLERGSLNVHCRIRTPCRNHACLGCWVGSHHIMPLQRVNRVICGADSLHIIVSHQAARCELRIILDHVVTLIIDSLRVGWVKGLLYAECGLELQVCPVVQWVTEGVRHGLSPLFKLLPVCGVLTGAEALVNTIGTHSAPLVVVAHKPNLSYRLKTLVLSYHLWNEVAMIVYDRHLGRMVVVQILRCLGLEQEVFVIKLFHVSLVSFVSL